MPQTLPVAPHVTADSIMGASDDQLERYIADGQPAAREISRRQGGDDNTDDFHDPYQNMPIAQLQQRVDRAQLASNEVERRAACSRLTESADPLLAIAEHLDPTTLQAFRLSSKALKAVANANITSLKICTPVELRWLCKNKSEYPKLRTLNLAHNFSSNARLTGDDLASLQGLGITSLDLTGVEGVSDQHLEYLSGLTLTHLVLRGRDANITAAGLKKLPTQTLHSLSLEYITLDDNCIKIICNMPKLKGLGLSSCKNVSNNTLRSLGSLSLTELDLARNGEVTDQGIAHLATWPLTSLALDCNQITGKALENLEKNPTLKTLKLGGNQHITGRDFRHLIGMNIEQLFLGNGFTQIADDDLLHLSQLPLKNLTVLFADHLTGLGFRHFRNTPLEKLALHKQTDFRTIGPNQQHIHIHPDAIGHLCAIESLRSLALPSCGIRDEQLQRFTPSNLKGLNLTRNEFISDKGIQHLSQLPLEKLNIDHCNHVTDNGMRHITQMHSLKHLILGGYGLRITEPVLSECIRNMQLHTLELLQTYAINDKALQQANPSVQVICKNY